MLDVMNDLCTLAYESLGLYERTKDYYKKPEQAYKEINEKIMHALQKEYGENLANSIYDDWMDAFYSYHHSMRISDFSIGVKFGLDFVRDLEEKAKPT